jgi:hypothetical protein
MLMETTKTFSRRQCHVMLLGVSTSLIAWRASAQSAEPERTKRQYMELAVGEISKRVADERAEANRKRRELEASGGAAPLFVQLPTIKPFVDWDYYYIDQDLRWAPASGSTLPPVRVPKGFVTDLASVPRPFWTKYPPVGRYAYAAVVHDYLYWVQTTTKDVADEIMMVAMRDAGTSESAIRDFKIALNLAGSIAWESNCTARKSGDKRLLRVPPTDPLVSWASWRTTPNVLGDTGGSAACERT